MKLQRKPARKNLKPIALTDRDRALLRCLLSYDVLSTEQAHCLCFPSVGRARKRLRQLWRHGYLSRLVRPVHFGEGSSANLYTLTRKGKELIAVRDAGDDSAITIGRPSISEHGLRINDFRVALSLATRGEKNSRVKLWRQGRELRFSSAVKSGIDNKVVPIIPDAFFTLWANNRDFNYCLEIDRGTIDLGRIKIKFLAYLNLWQSRAASAKLGILSFRILYVTTTEKRLLNMRNVLQSIKPSHRRLDLIYITCFKRYSLENPKRLFGPIWESVDSNGVGTTVRLLPAPLPSKLPFAPGNSPVREPEAPAS